MNWYKVYHGLPYDARLGAVARRSGLTRAEALCLLLCLLEHASCAARRGSVDGFDCELPAALFDHEPAKVEAAMAAFRDKGIINDENRIADWERQGVTNAERQRDYRARRRLAEEARLAPVTAKKHRFPVNETNPDSDAETAARRKRLGALAVTKSGTRIQGTEGTGR
ncbi:MAG: hypothetical protein IT560_06320 [Alphaproteobacteria bacterium]|nr:hypothetical protein [Alphaproteobacteria bacterium]